MASYGKHEYWEQRYTRNSDRCEWIAGYELIQRLLTPNFLCFSSAPPPRGVIQVQDLNEWLTNHLGPLLCIKNDRSCVIDEDNELDSMITELTLDFPSREKARILNVGCGTSSLSSDLVYHGWMNIVNVDYSKVVIGKMQARYGAEFYDSLQCCIQHDAMLRCTLGLESRDDDGHDFAEKPSMTFECADITKRIDHPDESFDLIICKKTLDVILCSAGSVAAARAMISECFRLLNPRHGVMMVLSSGKPDDRAVFWENNPWTGVLNVKLPVHQDSQRKGHQKKVAEHYVYILYKQNAAK